MDGRNFMAWTENKFRPALSGKQLNHLQRIKGTTGSWPQNDAEEIDAEKHHGKGSC